ncbi:MAG: hypothetical protein ACPGNT_02255 [Rhodospirillales bacterium]
MTAYVLNELTALPFWLACLRGRKPVYLMVDPVLPALQSQLERLGNRMVAVGKARKLSDIRPEADFMVHYPTGHIQFNLFAETEDWHNGRFFPDRVANLGDDELAFRKLTNDFMRFPYIQVSHLDFLERGEGEACEAKGIRAAARAIRAARDGNSWSATTYDPWNRGVSAVAVNLFSALAMTVMAMLWIARRTQFNEPAPKFFGSAVDFIADKSDEPVYEHLLRKGSVLVIPRVGNAEEKLVASVLAGQKLIRWGDARHSLVMAVCGFTTILRRIWGRFGQAPAMEPTLFYKLASLPLKRFRMRSLFNQYRPGVFWGRDPYNVEHLLRRPEMERIGGLSVGINIGYPSDAAVYSMFRWMDYHRYYVFGSGIYERYYNRFYPDHMTVLQVGAFRPTREQFARRDLPKPKDLVIFVGLFVVRPEMVAFVRELATTLTDRNILVQVKPCFLSEPIMHLSRWGESFFAACTDGLANVQRVEDGVYDLMDRASYAVSDPGSLVVEAMQFNLEAFCFDIPAAQRSNPFRDQPEINIFSAAELVSYIRDRESGARSYPWDITQDMVERSGRYYADMIAEDLETQMPVWGKQQ